jgi:hypothetical protein
MLAVGVEVLTQGPTVLVVPGEVVLQGSETALRVPVQLIRVVEAVVEGDQLVAPREEMAALASSSSNTPTTSPFPTQAAV